MAKNEPHPARLAATGLNLMRERGDGAPFELRGVSLTLPPGGFAIIRGASGGGKSSLLLALAGLIPRAGGAVSLDGKPQESFAPAAWRARVGLAQAEPLMVDGTVGENLLLAWSFKAGRARPRPTLEQLRENMDALALGEVALDSNAGRLSTGQRERVALLRTLLPGPEVLLADEPTANLDPKTAARVWDFLARFQREKGGTILCVTHEQPPPGVSQVLQVAGGRLEPVG